MKLRVFTAFSGYDSQCMALDRLGIDYDLVGWSEIDKYAIQAHNAVYPQWSGRNYGDISKISWGGVPDFDLFTYSFPCQDISTAGYQRGLEEGSGTRSSLLWECRKAIEAKRPKYMLMENVKALTGKKFMPYLQKWMDYLGGLGYSNYMKVLNAKNYGVPQNRERTFMVSVLGGGDYNFPEPFELKARLKDVLEPEVEERYYLKKELPIRARSGKNVSIGLSGPIACSMNGRNPDNPTDRKSGAPTTQMLELGEDVSNCITTVQKDSMVYEPNVLTPKRTEYGKRVRKDYESGVLKESRHNMTELEPRKDGICNTITTVQKDNPLAEPRVIRMGNTNSSGHGMDGNVFPDCGLSPALTTDKGEGSRIFQAMPQNNVEFYEEKDIIGVSVNPNGRKLEFKGLGSIKNTCPSLRATDYKCPHTVWESGASQDYRIRKLTPRECFRLMGVSEENIDKIQQAGISNSQQYKMAGNSIVVDVMYYIFKNLFAEGVKPAQKKENVISLTIKISL